MLALARALARNGVVGINRRNADYVLLYNRRRDYPLVDDKMQTKLLAAKFGIAVPTLYGKIEFPHEVRRLPEIIADQGDFVLKPAQGSGGDGILIVVGRTGDLFRLADGSFLSADDMAYHVSTILAGTFSLGGQNDKALIEYRVNFDPMFERISFRGIPDIRIVVFLGVPVMAMVRLPTRMSRGKANLHQGAIGAGVSIDEGKTLTAVLRTDVVNRHPDTQNPVQDVAIPHWDRLLEMAALSYEMTNLGYQGIDIVLDKDKGPLVLELNARPGLNIQIANREGLGHRLALVEANKERLTSAMDRVAFAKANFRPRPVAV